MNNGLQKFNNALEIIISIFALVWVAGFYFVFTIIIANKVIPRFSIYNLLFWAVSVANFGIFINIILNYVKLKIRSKYLRVIIAIVFIIMLISVIIFIFMFLKI